MEAERLAIGAEGDKPIRARNGISSRDGPIGQSVSSLFTRYDFALTNKDRISGPA